MTFSIKIAFKLLSCYLVAMQLWASHWTSLSLGILNCEKESGERDSVTPIFTDLCKVET